MIKLRSLITEAQMKYGCIMAYIDGDIKDKIVKFNKDLIPDDVLYDNEEKEFGREKDPHVTIKYGFTKSYTKEEVEEMLKDITPFKIKLSKISLFENEEFDVVKFDVVSEKLKELNKKFSKLPNEDEHPDYHPHSTLAYVKKGKGKDFIKGSKKFAEIEITRIVYSDKGDKTSITLKQDVTEGLTQRNYEAEISELQKEWDRLDNMGGREVQQREISKKIQDLQKLKGKWEKMYNATS